MPQNLSRGKCVLDCTLQISRSSINVRCPNIPSLAGLTNPPGLDRVYERQFTLVVSNDSTSRRTAELKHYPHGPFLLVACRKFRPTEHYQTRALRKDSSGWHAVQTTPYCLINAEIDISAYVRACTGAAIDEACKRGDLVSSFFILAHTYRNVSAFLL